MLELRTIRADEIEAAKTVMAAGFQEIWGLTYAEIACRYDPLKDMDAVQDYYLDRNGAFLVLLFDGRVVGTGGIAQVDTETAEMKRLWLLKEYRGLGLGRQMAEALLCSAEAHGYRRVRLNLVTPELQPQAAGLYASLGFEPFSPTADGAGLFLEKRLGSALQTNSPDEPLVPCDTETSERA